MTGRQLTQGGDQSVKFCCPSCGTCIERPLHWYKSHSHYECEGCEAVILLDADQLTPFDFAHLRRIVNLILPNVIPSAMVLKGLGILCHIVKNSPPL